MIDRRRILIISSLVAVAIVAIIVAIVLVVGNQKEPPAAAPETAETTPGTVEPTPTPSADEEAVAAIQTFKNEYRDMARDAAIIASSWNGSTAPELRVARYKQAGLSDSLAASYRPVWADVFGDNITAEITTTVDNNLDVNEATGEEGSYVWRIAATVTFKGTWAADGTTKVQTPRQAVWWLTIDQATKTVVAIDQPSPDDLQITVNEEDK